MRKYLIPSLLSAIFFLSNLFILSDYGINWDSPLHFLRGQAYSHLYLTGQDSYGLEEEVSPNLVSDPGHRVSRYYFASSEMWDDAPGGVITLPPRPLPQQTDRKIFYQSEGWNGQYFKEYDWGGHLPLVSILSAFSNKFFWGVLNWMGDLESYQLISLFISSLGVFIVSLFALEVTRSWLAGVIAGLSLGLFPLFWAESHINLKDPEQAVFFAGSLWAFWHWIRSSSRAYGLRWFMVFTAFVGLALAVKWNIVFLPFIILPWLVLIRKTEEFKKWFKLKKLLICAFVFLILTSLFLTAIWPYSWGRPWVLTHLFEYYLDVGTGAILIQPTGFTLPAGFNLYPLVLFLTQTPEIILVLGVLGVVWAVRGSGGDKTKTGYLLLLWLLIPLIRVILPGARSYAGIRQIMEVLPVMAILAGVGAGYLPSVILSAAKNLLRMPSLTRRMQVSNKLRGPSGFSGESFRLPFALRAEPLRMTIVVSVLILLLLPIIKLHPNQNAYFNSLVGGLAGAKEKNLIDWTLTYGNIYKQAASWINKNAEMNSNIAHLAGSDFALSPLWLREDISISPYHFSGFEQKGEYIMALYNPLDPPVFAKRYPEKFLRPVHQIEVDGVALLFIYKNDPKYLKVDLNKEKELKVVKMVPQTTKEADFWKVDLGRQVEVTRIVINGVDVKCGEGQNEQVLSFGNEAIAFLLEADSATIDLSKAYVLNEKRDLGDGKVEYLFAAEEASFIYIYPQNDQSCFAREKVLSVNYLTVSGMR